MTAASQDIRLARRNDVFDRALMDTPGQLIPSDRIGVEAAIRYLGARYQVDEICVIAMPSECGNKRAVVPKSSFLLTAESLENFRTVASEIGQNSARVVQFVRRRDESR